MTMPVAAFRVSPYADADREGVLDLICTIQRGELQIPITAEDQPDLLDVPGFYRRGCGNFWVARAGDGVRGGVVGSIALVDIGGGQGALRKMFVERDWRGAGVALALLEALLGWCAAHSVREIFLGTTTRFLAAHRFYEKHGFERIEKSALPPAFPVMGVDSVFYRKGL